MLGEKDNSVDPSGAAGGMESWQDQPHAEGLAPILGRNLLPSRIDWKELADKLSARPEGFSAISSDGDLPAHLDRNSRSSLNKITHRAEADIRERLRGRGSIENHSLRYLTWQFHRCPQWVVEPMIDALVANRAGHPFRINSAATTLLLQGIGRTASSPSDQRRIFDFLFRVRPENWNKNHLACAAFLLSRNDNAPMLLERKGFEFLAVVAALKMRKVWGRNTHQSLSMRRFSLSEF